MTTAEETAFFAAICDEPDEDTRRLAYADWLDEHEVSELKPCPTCSSSRRSGRVGLERRCTFCGGDGTSGDYYSMRRCVYCDGEGILQDKCQTCNGVGAKSPGFVCVSNGNAERAEFIRVQISLANHEPCPQCEISRKRHTGSGKGICHGKAGLIITASKLQEKYLEWRPKCPVCNGVGEVVIQPSAQTCGCSHCGGHGPHFGTGRIGTLQRGFLYSVTVPRLRDVLQQALEVDDDGHEVWGPTPWARELVRAFPTVERVVCTDHEPWTGESDGVSFGHQWWDRPDHNPDGTEISDNSVLIPPLMEWMRKNWKPQYHRDEDGVQSVKFVTREDATDALAECVANVLKEMCR